MKILLLPLLLLHTWGATPRVPAAASPLLPAPFLPTDKPGGAMVYDFTRPLASFAMPAELAELSGIAWSGPNELMGVEDETGNLYAYNLAAKRVARVLPFAPSGDYEDLARVGSDWFVLRSDGTLFRYSGKTTQKFDTGLTFANEPEGLTYDAAAKTLLVACKGEPGAGLPATKRAIYRLRPGTYRAAATPAFVLDTEAIAAALPGSAAAPVPGKKGKKKGGGKGFAPSAVAVHPLTRHVFVLSARPGTLVELDAAGRLLAAQSLPADLFPQAEGLAFTASGELYIATEAGKKSGQARIHHFSPRR